MPGYHTRRSKEKQTFDSRAELESAAGDVNTAVVSFVAANWFSSSRIVSRALRSPSAEGTKASLLPLFFEPQERNEASG